MNTFMMDDGYFMADSDDGYDIFQMDASTSPHLSGASHAWVGAGRGLIIILINVHTTFARGILLVLLVTTCLAREEGTCRTAHLKLTTTNGTQ